MFEFTVQRQGKSFLLPSKKHSCQELDTSRIYGGGTTEKFLGDLDGRESFKVHTKVYPTKGKSMGLFSGLGYSHSGPDVRRSLMDSLRALKLQKIDLFYLMRRTGIRPLKKPYERLTHCTKWVCSTALESATSCLGRWPKSANSAERISGSSLQCIREFIIPCTALLSRSSSLASDTMASPSTVFNLSQVAS